MADPNGDMGFMKREYEALRSQIIQTRELMERTERYGFAGALGIFAFLLSRESGGLVESGIGNVAFFLPAIVLLYVTVRVFQYSVGNRMIGAYILKRFGKAGLLGERSWEHTATGRANVLEAKEETGKADGLEADDGAGRADGSEANEDAGKPNGLEAYDGAGKADGSKANDGTEKTFGQWVFFAIRGHGISGVFALLFLASVGAGILMISSPDAQAVCPGRPSDEPGCSATDGQGPITKPSRLPGSPRLYAPENADGDRDHI